MRLPGITRRKVGTMSNHHALYALGYTRATMAVSYTHLKETGERPVRTRRCMGGARAKCHWETGKAARSGDAQARRLAHGLPQRHE